MTADQQPRQQHPVFGVVVQLVAKRARRRLAWLDTLRGERGLGPIDDPDAEQQYYAEHEPLAQINQQIAELEHAFAQSEDDPIHGVAALFGLTNSDLDLLITCMAPALEPTLGEVYDRLQGARGQRY